MDFDGDELYGIFLKETEMVKDFFSMHPSRTIHSKNRPEISNMVTLMDQTMLMQNNWLMGDPYYEKVDAK